MTVKRTVAIDADRLARLKRIAESTGRPMSELAQEGVSVVLDLAEKQQDTIERVVARIEAGDGGDDSQAGT